MRRLAIALASASLVVGLMAGTAFAGNPSGTGQPNASCEESTMAPNGFSSGGFTNAEAHYAGNGAPSRNANSGNAVSQYDVACYQVSLHH
jgi:hypothetical protein